MVESRNFYTRNSEKARALHHRRNSRPTAVYRVLDSPKHSAALSRELADLERLAEPHWRLESLAAPLAPKKMCVGARALRARSAALSKVIVRTEQNNFAGGGAVAGLVLRAPVEQMLWAPKTHHDILYRMLRTRQKPLRGALRRAGGRRTFRGTARGSVATPPVAAQCVRRPGRGGRTNGYFSRLAWSKVGQMKTLRQ